MQFNMKMTAIAFGVLVSMAMALQGFAQTGDAASSPKDTADQANPADIASIDAIVGAVYDVISGPAGPRDWARMRSLFVPGGRLMVRSPQAPDGITTMTLEDYENLATPLFMKDGFFERGIRNKIVRYDGIANVFSTYESRHAKDDAKPFARGINSMQLLHHNDRWWIINIYWQSETKDAPIPSRFLP